MERLIDLTKFLIIKPTNLDEMIEQLGLNLSKSDPVYLATLIAANIMAIIVIYLFITLVLKLTKKITGRKNNDFGKVIYGRRIY